MTPRWEVESLEYKFKYIASIIILVFIFDNSF